MEKNKYEIRYSEQFNRELVDVFNYIVYELENNIAAENLMQLIEKEIKIRSESPESFNFFKLEKEGMFKWYRINVNNYVILYTVENNIMTMRRFLYCKRNFDKLI